MPCWVNEGAGTTNAQVPDKIDANTVRFSGHFKLTDCGTGNGVLIPANDAEATKRGGCRADIRIYVKSQKKNNNGGWDDINTSTSISVGDVEYTESHTVQYGGDLDTYRCRARAEVTYCNGHTEQFPHGGGWDTSAERRF